MCHYNYRYIPSKLLLEAYSSLGLSIKQFLAPQDHQTGLMRYTHLPAPSTPRSRRLCLVRPSLLSWKMFLATLLVKD